MQTTAIPKNHMDIPWHEYSGHGNCPITEADLTEKASIVGRVGLMLLSCENRYIQSTSDRYLSNM